MSSKLGSGGTISCSGTSYSSATPANTERGGGEEERERGREREREGEREIGREREREGGREGGRGEGGREGGREGGETTGLAGEQNVNRRCVW